MNAPCMGMVEKGGSFTMLGMDLNKEGKGGGFTMSGG